MRLNLVLEIAIILMGTVAPAQADTKRVRLPLSQLPRQDKALAIDPKSAVLPDGAREGSAVPKTWKLAPAADGSIDEYGRCTDDRRGAVDTGYNAQTGTTKVFEANGRTFVDFATVKVEDGKVHVVSAERIPLTVVSDGIWAYRAEGNVSLLLATDTGLFSKAITFGCRLRTAVVSAPAGTVTVRSSPEEAEDVWNRIRAMEAAPKKPPPPVRWKGRALTAFASVSKTSADPEPMLNVVIHQQR